MKKIDLKKVVINVDVYTITLGDGTIHHFKNLKAAKNFQVSINHQLTNLLTASNFLFADLFHFYRENWLLLSSPSIRNPKSYEFSINKITQDFNFISNVFDLLTTNHFHNSNYYRIYKDFELIFDSFLSVILSLSNILSQRKHAPTTYKLSFFLSTLQFQRNSLENLSKSDLSHKISIGKLADTIKHNMDYQNISNL